MVSEGREPRSRLADLLIAATAHTNGLDLYTRNDDDFAGLEQLFHIVAIRLPGGRTCPNWLRTEWERGGHRFRWWVRRPATHPVADPERIRTRVADLVRTIESLAASWMAAADGRPGADWLVGVPVGLLG